MSLTARTSKFRKGMTGASKRVRAFAADVGRSAKRVAMFGAATGAAAAGGLAILVKQSMKIIDATAKMSDRLGITTEALTALQHAAEITGAGTETLNKGLEQMVRRIGEAQSGTGEAAAMLDKLGLSAMELSKVGADEAFKQISERLAKIPTEAGKAEAAYRLFGRQGVKLVNTLALGRAGLEAMREEAERLGLVFTRVDAAQIEAANDAMGRLWRMIQGAAHALSIELAPFIEATAKKLVAMGSAGEGMRDKVVDAFGWVLKVSVRVWDTLEYGKAAFKFLQATATTALLGIMGPLDTLATGIRKFSEMIGIDLAKDFKSWTSTARKGIEQTIAEFSGEAARHLKAAQSGARSKAATAFLAQVKKNAKAAAEATATAAEAQRELAKKVEVVTGNLKIQERVTKAAEAAKPSKAAALTNQRGQARQVQLDRQFLGQVGQSRTARKQEVRDPEALAELKKLVAAIGPSYAGGVIGAL